MSTHFAAPDPIATIGERLARVGVKLPATVSTEDIGVVLDADGAAILVVDQHGVRADEDVDVIAVLLVVALNAGAALRVEEGRS